MNLLIIACSATKRHDAGLLPALHRYDGPLYRIIRRALAERPQLAARLTIRILSAEYGLISADTPIPDYDQRMTPARARELCILVMHELQELPAHERTYIDLGKTYLGALHPGWGQGAEWAQGGIGYRLSQCKTWLWRQA